MGQLLMEADKWAQWEVVPPSCAHAQSQQHGDESSDAPIILVHLPCTHIHTILYMHKSADTGLYLLLIA